MPNDYLKKQFNSDLLKNNNPLDVWSDEITKNSILGSDEWREKIEAKAQELEEQKAQELEEQKAKEELAKQEEEKTNQEFQEIVENAEKISVKKTDTMRASVKAVEEMLNTNPAYTIFIDFSMNNEKFHVSTISQDTNENITMNLQNNKNGTGNANEFTLTIGYSPQDGSEFDVNRIDKAITEANTSEGKAELRYCTLQYGYANMDNTELYRSPKYRGIVLNYSCEINDGILVYTLKGYSGISMIKESKEPLAIKTGSNNKIKPTEAAAQIINVYLQGAVQGGTTTGSIDEEGKINNAQSIERHPISSSVSYELLATPGTLGSDVELEIPAQLDKNPASALTDILGKAILKADKDILDSGNSLSPTDKTVYGWYVSDVSSDASKYPSGSITIYKQTPAEMQKDDVDAEFIFNWMSPGEDSQTNHIVISFKPEYQGSVLMAITTGNLVDSQSFYQDNNGVVKSVENSLSPPVGGSEEAALATIEQEKASWAEQVQYPYAATMITAGIPAEIPILTKIKVRPLIYGQEHHSSGTYIVLKISDQLDTSGFRTTWELRKIEIPIQIKSAQVNSGETKDANETSSDTPENLPPAATATPSDKLSLNKGPISDQYYEGLRSGLDHIPTASEMLQNNLSNEDNQNLLDVWDQSLTTNPLLKGDE